MNYYEFYNNIQNRLTDAVLSLWATGNKDLQSYLRALITKDPLVSEIVFQSTFPWTPDDLTFGQVESIFQKTFINALDSIKNPEFRFPKERHPYKHQVQSWKDLILDKKSIAVTTGTGSGKTECFMLPVLYDTYQNSRNQTGINAIFLYPLNALIASQRKRMHEWCKALGGIQYAVLTGDTENTPTSNIDINNAYPELISRVQIRKTPPPILFTNPTMLEYMMVRNQDAPILEKSKGKLRWILLDEAHTLTGSKAAEMALLIRRVLSSFEVSSNDVRFAITSATVGNGNESTLKNFMSKLCGISVEQISVIGGSRVLPNETLDSTEWKFNLNKNKVVQLREEFIRNVGFTQSEVGKRLNLNSQKDQIQVMDYLSDSGTLPLRAHYFVRGIGGVYVCTNINCNIHNDEKPKSMLGTIHLTAGKNCSCGFTLLEMISCRSCGHTMLEGDKFFNEKKQEYIRQKASVGYEAFHIENESEEDNENEGTGNVKNVRFVRFENKFGNSNYKGVSFEIDGKMNGGSDFVKIEDSLCPHCQNKNDNPRHYRLSSAFTNRVLSDLILEQTKEADKKTGTMLNDGKKYISFTDSRQGTAKISALINKDNQTQWIRYQVYHYLLKKLKNNNNSLSEQERNELLIEKNETEQDLNTDLSPRLRDKLKERLKEIEAILNPTLIDRTKSRSSWDEIYRSIKTSSDLKTLFFKAARGGNFAVQGNDYLVSLLFDQFAKRRPQERSLENLGLVNVVYPVLENIILPDIAKQLGIDQSEWTDLLKISCDYIIRYESHFFLEDSIQLFSRNTWYLSTIYPLNTNIQNVIKWPSYSPNSIHQNRLVLLICAGLDWTEPLKDPMRVDQLNELLHEIWKTLRAKVLKVDGNGFKLQIQETITLEIASKVYLCPVTNRLLDKVFRGYTPWIKGNLTQGNIENYRLKETEPFEFPIYEYPDNRTPDNLEVDQKFIRDWMDLNSREAKRLGLWNNLHEKTFNFGKLYLAGEHSAQQDKNRLSELEKQFEEGEINILSCSTTMEMGVDIGGISAVVMSNVPPMSANYLQRTGRAGRRGEAKSLALTFCAPNPLGLRAMNNPKWALEHPIAPPILSFDSKQIVERHVNSLLLGLYLRSQPNPKEGHEVKQTIEKFFFDQNNPIGQRFINWMESIDQFPDNDKEKIYNQIQSLIIGTPIQNTPEVLIKRVINDFTKLVEKTRDINLSYDKKKKELSKLFGSNSSAYKAVNYRQLQFYGKFLLTYLSEEEFLPNAGIPTGIVEFDKSTLEDIRKTNYFKSNPSYSKSRALIEYAPGNKIVIDGLSYESSGIVMESFWGNSATINVVQACDKCGFQRILKVNESLSDCPKCKTTNSFRGLVLGDRGNISKYTEMVEPAGFSVDLFKEPNRDFNEVQKPQYLEPLLINLEPWREEQFTSLDFRLPDTEELAEILFYNTGMGKGYSICLDCGRTAYTHDGLRGHKRLRGGKQPNGESICSASNIKNKTILGSRFNTDFVEIRLLNSNGTLVNDKTLLYSLGTTFTKSLSKYLGIEESELGFGTKKYNTYQTIFIYDTAKGGAGYSTLFTRYTTEILEDSLKTLKNCDCKNVCTKCMIDRNTQWHIENLDRKAAIDWLENHKKIEIPKELENTTNPVRPVFGNLIEEINRINYLYGIKEIRIHSKNNVGDWNLVEMPWLRKLLREEVKVSIVSEGKIDNLNQEEKLTLYSLKAKGIELFDGIGQNISTLKVMLYVSTNDGKQLHYVTTGELYNLNQEWGQVKDCRYILVENINSDNLKQIDIPDLDSLNLIFFESKIDTLAQPIQSDNLAIEMIKKFNDSSYKSKIEGKKYNVRYVDKYNRSEFSLRLMIQFLESFCKINLIEIQDYIVVLNERDFKIEKYNYSSIESYERDLIEIAKSVDFPITLERSKIYLPHYRLFEFKSENSEFNLRIDGGIAHGFAYDHWNIRLPLRNEVFEIKKIVSHDIIYVLRIVK